MKSDIRMKNYVRADSKERKKTKTGWTFKSKYNRLYIIKSMNEPSVILPPLSRVCKPLFYTLKQ